VVNNVKLSALKSLNDGQGANPLQNQYDALLNTLNYTPTSDDIKPADY
jgi:hypothetical protein